MSTDTDRDNGRFEETVSDNDILLVFEQHDAPFMSAKEVAEELPITKSAVNHRLNKMSDEGLVAKKKIGARAAGWWALEAPRLSDQTKAALRESESDQETGAVVGHDDLKDRLGLE